MIPADSFFGSLVDAAARSLLLACAVGLGLAVLRVRNVVAQKTAWILVLAASVAMPLVARWAAHASWLPDRDTFVVSGHAWSSKTVRDSAPPVAMSMHLSVTRQAEAEVPTQSALAPSPAPDASSSPAPAIATETNVATQLAPAPVLAAARQALAWITPMRALLLIYLAICGMLALRVAYGAWAAFRLWRRAQPASPDWIALTGGIRVRISDAISSPVTIGSGIVLPVDCCRWDSEKLGIVLAHEGSHVRQRDFVLQLAASLYIAVTWFSPLGWWLKRKLSDLSETISDGAAVHRAASHASYAQVLLEFAALPRPLTSGVAMAHRGNLRSRIEDLLNESRFRQAFSGGRLRLAAAILLVPAALFVATAMVRVQAAGQQAPPATAPEPGAAPQSAPAPPSTPSAAPQSPRVPAPPAAGESPAGAPEIVPPPPPEAGNDQVITVPKGAVVVTGPNGPYFGPGFDKMIKDSINLATNNQVLLQANKAAGMAFSKGFGRGFWSDGNPYAYVTGQGENGVHYSGNWFDDSREEIEKARKVAHGDFLWFERDGKSYVIDDPATLAELKPMQDKIDALGKQQEELGKQQEELGKQQEELGRQMQQLRVPTPDMQKELEKLKAVQAKMTAIQGKDASQEQLAEIESELAEVQGQLGALQGDMGGRMGELGGKQGELGAQQGKLGAQQGRLGAEQGRIAREMDGKALTIIDESLKNGKARPVQ